MKKLLICLIASICLFMASCSSNTAHQTTEETTTLDPAKAPVITNISKVDISDDSQGILFSLVCKDYYRRVVIIASYEGKTNYSSILLDRDNDYKTDYLIKGKEYPNRFIIPNDCFETNYSLSILYYEVCSPTNPITTTQEQTTTQFKDYVIFSSFDVYDETSGKYCTKKNELSYRFLTRDGKNIFEFYTRTDLYDVRVTYQLYSNENYLREDTAYFVRLKPWEYKEYIVELTEEDHKQSDLKIKILMVVYKYC